jgi:predicted nucleic acid-binding protein
VPGFYFDTCSLCRLWDLSEEFRVKEEAGAVRALLERVREGKLFSIAGDALERELDGNPREPQHTQALDTLNRANVRIEAHADDALRGIELVRLGFRSGDALHIACAERGGAEALLTVDDRMLRCAARNLGQLHVRVLNPVHYLREIEHDG